LLAVATEDTAGIGHSWLVLYLVKAEAEVINGLVLYCSIGQASWH